MTTINGFVVVRLPKWNEVAPGKVLPMIENVAYEGIDRWEWADVFDEDFYSGSAPEGVRELAEALEDSGGDLSGIRLTQSYSDAQLLETYSNRVEPRNEIAVVASSALDQVKGQLEFPHPVEWLGVDVFAEGEWSLISAGIFAQSEHSRSWIPRLNRHGLFDDDSCFDEFVDHYLRESANGKFEELAARDAGFRIIPVRVGRPSRLRKGDTH